MCGSVWCESHSSSRGQYPVCSGLLRTPQQHTIISCLSLCWCIFFSFIPRPSIATPSLHCPFRYSYENAPIQKELDAIEVRVTWSVGYDVLQCGVWSPVVWGVKDCSVGCEVLQCGRLHCVLGNRQVKQRRCCPSLHCRPPLHCRPSLHCRPPLLPPLTAAAPHSCCRLLLPPHCRSVMSPPSWCLRSPRRLPATPCLWTTASTPWGWLETARRCSAPKVWNQMLQHPEV